MVLFFLLLKALSYLIKFFIFIKNKNTNLTENDLDKKDSLSSLNMIQCEKCKIYISKEEAKYYNGKAFCKKEHFVD